MSYFSNFPSQVYDLSLRYEPPLTFAVRDITTNVRFRKDILENVVAFEVYDIQDGESPEKISENLYGSPYYHWVIMLINERYDYLNDFPMAQRELEALIDQKYGDQKFAIKQYETVEIKNSAGRVLLKPGLVVSSTYTFSYSEYVNLEDPIRRVKIADILVPNSQCTVPISNYDFEFRRNESLRQIKVLTPELLDEIILRFRQALGIV
jgi:hypothetical protein